MSILVGIYHACFLRLERIVFYGDHHQTLYQCVFKSKRKYEKHLYYWPKSWVTPLGNLQFSGYIPCMCFESRKDCFLLRTSKSYIISFLSKTKNEKKNHICGQNHELTTSKIFLMATIYHGRL